MKIVINTPAGNVGRVLTDRLPRTKEEIVVISRHPEKVRGLILRGACSLKEFSRGDQACRRCGAVPGNRWIFPLTFKEK